MDELDILYKREVAIQELLYKDSVLQVDIPLHPVIFFLDDIVRLDVSIATSILLDKEFIDECESDIGKYVKNVDYMSEDQKNVLHLSDFQKFKTSWKFSFSQSKHDSFLNLRWNDCRTVHELCYINIPTAIFNYKKSPECLWSAEDIASQIDMHPNSLFFGRENFTDASLILFENPAKFTRFNYNREANYDLENKNSEITLPVFTFSSSYLENIPQAIILRNFGVRYLNKLASLALESNN